MRAGKQLFDLADPWAFYVITALKAKELFQKDQQYIVGEAGQVSIVDSFTGRVLQGRRFSDGLQQAIEAKVRYAMLCYAMLFYTSLCGMPL